MSDVIALVTLKDLAGREWLWMVTGAPQAVARDGTKDTMPITPGIKLVISEMRVVKVDD